MTGGAAVAAADADRRTVFQRLADRELDRAYRTAGVILGSRPDAEAATPDAVALAWRSSPPLRDTSRFEVWFQRILVNVCRDRLRKRKRSPVSELRVGEAGATT